MASATAMRLCPDLLILPGRFDAYREASAAMRDIFNDYTELVEPLSLDEAFLDVSDCLQQRGSATLIAEEICQRIEQQIDITVSAGVAPNKFLAKVASDWNKPNGIFVISPDQVDDFVTQLPVKKLFGVGKVTATRLQKHGITVCGDLRRFDVFELTRMFGSFGKRLHELGQGIDDRTVKPSRKRKSLSVERTYSSDLETLEQCLDKLPSLLDELNGRLLKVDKTYLVTRVFAKLKFSDFTQTTVESTGETPGMLCLGGLLARGFDRSACSVRLLGVGVRFVDVSMPSEWGQLDLFAGHEIDQSK
jgi:DNA polymerase-4